jgi:hypothetical protein
MSSNVIEVEIAAHPDRVFAQLMDTESYGDWVVGHHAWPQGPPELTAGSTFTQELSLMGKSTPIEWKVEELRSPTYLQLEATGKLGLTIQARYHLESNGEGTRLRFESDGTGGPLSMPGRLGSAVRDRVTVANEATIAQFKAVVEGSDSHPVAADRQQPRFANAYERVAARRRAITADRLANRASNEAVLQALEANTRAMEELTAELKRARESAPWTTWLSGPLDLLRRGSAVEFDPMGG